MFKTGIIRIEGEGGKITGVYLNPNLDKYYKRLYVNAFRSVKKDPNKVEHGIKLIVFGAFYVEAISNELYQKMLSIEIKNEHLYGAIWNITKRLKILDKLYLVTEAVKINKNESKKFLSDVQKLFDLRNRLAHLKDEDEVYESYLSTLTAENEIEHKKLIETFMTMPDPTLIGKISGTQILEYGNLVKAIEKQIKELYKNYITIKYERKKTSNDTVP